MPPTYRRVLGVAAGLFMLAVPLATPAFGAGITFAAGYNPASIVLGQTSTLTFSVTNTTVGTLTGVTFTDTLPAGLTIATPSGIIGFCTGGSAGVVTGNAGGVSTSLNVFLIAGTLCTYSINVFASQIGVFTTSGLTATGSGGTSGVAPDFSLTVVSASAVPEPASVTLVLLGLAGGAGFLRRRQKRA